MKSPEEFAKYLNDYLPDPVLPEQIANRDEQIREEQCEACWDSVRENADSIEIHGMGLNGEPYYQEYSVMEAILSAGKEKSDD